MDSFLSRLPQSVIKAGKIIDVRSGVEETIKVINKLIWNNAPYESTLYFDHELTTIMDYNRLYHKNCHLIVK
jgi:hypothetical protein